MLEWVKRLRCAGGERDPTLATVRERERDRQTDRQRQRQRQRVTERHREREREREAETETERDADPKPVTGGRLRKREFFVKPVMSKEPRDAQKRPTDSLKETY